MKNKKRIADKQKRVVEATEINVAARRLGFLMQRGANGKPGAVPIKLRPLR